MATSQSHMPHDGSDPLQTEFAARVDQIARDRRLLSPGELGRRATAIQSLAEHHHRPAAAALARELAHAFAAPGQDARAMAILDSLRAALVTGNDNAAPRTAH